jgi:mono/diheme cytochrome c family protein
MHNNKLFGVSALFDSPDKIISAAKKTTEAGYSKFDVNTPYPVHGMEKAMNLKPSKLGFITLVFGLSGSFIALFFMYWSMSIDYPMIIGGKPFFALPAFIPVTFEVTVLLATLATVIGMITFFFRFPENHHPLHDTNYMKQVSKDKFGLVIEASDKNFEIEKVKEFLQSLNPVSIEEIYYQVKEENSLLEPRFLTLLFAIALVTSGTTYFALNKLLYMTPFNWMSEQLKLNPQKPSELFADGFGMRTPVKGTVAKGFMPYLAKGQPNPTELLENPYLITEENIKLGKSKYLTFCSPCHGNFGDGDSRLRGQFPNPPSLHSQRARDFKDGMIYHVIVNGQNSMPSYAPYLDIEERWAIVNYIRVLQRAKNASDSDIQFVKKENLKNASN